MSEEVTRILCPCRLGERFSSDRGEFYLNGLDFFDAQYRAERPPVLCGNKHKGGTFTSGGSIYMMPEWADAGKRIAFEIPRALILPGYPLRKMGIDLDGRGYLQGVSVREDSWVYWVYYGDGWDGLGEPVRTEALDKLFEPILPVKQVRVDISDYL